MKTIIAATDFSPAATNAVNYAIEMAKSLDAELLLFNVYNIPVNYSEGVMVMPVEELKTGSMRDLETLKQDILGRTGGKILVSIHSRMGSMVEELEDLCRAKRPFAVVIGTLGKTNFEKSVFGSSTLSIIRHLKWPVICVPPGTRYGSGIRKVGLACDFRDVADTVPAEEIRKFISAFKPELHILNVDYQDKHFRTSTPEDSFTLHQLFSDEKPSYHYIEDPDIEVGIYDFVKEQKLDMLITIPKKHTFLEKIFRKSNTKKLVEATPSALVCIHA